MRPARYPAHAAIAMTIIAALSAPATTPAAVTVTPAAQAPRVAALVSRAQTPVVENQRIELASCPGYPALAGCNFQDRSDSPIYIRPDSFSTSLLYRELGGRFATIAMDQGARNRFASIMRTRDTWGNAVDSDGTLEFGLVEQFEDAYANCALGHPRVLPTLQNPHDEWIAVFMYDPTPRQHRSVCALIRHAGTRAGLAIPAPPLGGHSTGDPNRRPGARRAYRSTA
jgi:hypothetical protein